MRKAVWFWILLVVAAVALGASTILLVDYLKPAPVFCDESGGCGAVRQTVFAYPFKIPLPVFGISGIVAIALLGVLSGRRARIAQAVVASLGAAFALVLLGVQWKLHTLCPYCAVVDGSMLVLAAISIARARSQWEPPAGWKPVAGSLALLGLAFVLPIAVGRTKKPIPAGLPGPIAEEMRRTPRGKVTVVDFVDFECPFCRMTHAELAPLLEQRRDKVRLVRRHVPLRIHRHALDAARAGSCGESLGKGDEMADALFKAPPDALTPEGCETIAESIGLDLNRFRACVKAPETDARIKQDGEVFKQSQGRGLPTLWFDSTRLVGSQDHATLEKTLDHAIRAL